eukprot:12914170-Prorocentrum_lima.AAC.1
MAQLVPAENFAETHTWTKGQIKGKVALFVDDLLQTGAKQSNMEFVKALEKKWTMSRPEHSGPIDRHETLKLLGVTISRQPTKINGMDEGTHFLGR